MTCEPGDTFSITKSKHREIQGGILSEKEARQLHGPTQVSCCCKRVFRNSRSGLQFDLCFGCSDARSPTNVNRLMFKVHSRMQIFHKNKRLTWEFLRILSLDYLLSSDRCWPSFVVTGMEMWWTCGMTMRRLWSYSDIVSRANRSQEPVADIRKHKCIPGITSSSMKWKKDLLKTL